ncbi:MAG: SDR family NAD(P)-dependent oxidoreductase [SAR324 cluster bacterium]|nr:SDR family NAD(P)-dependent oxidoreductase [SAR324 cluster bacterium]MBF0351231.1 SDR family NAD(P)-dependent oxidoreductase [SAR324 cluster bacterium]
MTKFRLKGKVAIVAGASQGLGREISLKLAENGTHLVLAARNQENLERVAGECIGRGVRVLAFPMDVSDKEQCQQLIEASLKHFHYQVDMLIHCAGVQENLPLSAPDSLVSLEYLMAVNYFGCVYLTNYAMPHLIRNRGVIVGVIGLQGRFGGLNQAGFAASKHALAGFFESLRYELEASRVGVTMAFPGDWDSYAQSAGNETSSMNVREVWAQIIIEGIQKRRHNLYMERKTVVNRMLQFFSPRLANQLLRRFLD